MRILVADDNAANRRLVTYLLEASGHTALAAKDGIDGLALIRRERPDCVLLDMAMPGLDGHAVLRAVRSDPAIAATPIIASTADGRPGALAGLLEEGFDGYLPKPIEVETFIDDVMSVAERASRASEGAGPQPDAGNFPHVRSIGDAGAAFGLPDALAPLAMAFVAGLEHDMRGDISTILGFARLVRDERVGPLLPAQRSALDDIIAGGQSLAEMLQHLIVAVGGADGKVRPALAVSRVCALVGVAARPPGPAPGVHVEARAGGHVTLPAADAGRLAIALFGVVRALTDAVEVPGQIVIAPAGGDRAEVDVVASPLPARHPLIDKAMAYVRTAGFRVGVRNDANSVTIHVDPV